MKTNGGWFETGARLVLFLSFAVALTGCCKLRPNANCNSAESVPTANDVLNN